MNKNIITLNTGDGTADFEFLDLIRLEIHEEEREFIVVCPLGCDEVTILEMETYGEAVVFVNVDGDDIYLAVWKAFARRNSDKYDFGGMDELLC